MSSKINYGKGSSQLPAGALPLRRKALGDVKNVKLQSSSRSRQNNEDTVKKSGSYLIAVVELPLSLPVFCFLLKVKRFFH